ncbi:hypothetical protein B0H14DRAFT_1155542 [Mycena olivaceomarginata]|nr:hypothetical protein B0H14DRAFT_1155542 [Mycena olivaceomarginata]
MRRDAGSRYQVPSCSQKSRSWCAMCAFLRRASTTMSSCCDTAAHTSTSSSSQSFRGPSASTLLPCPPHSRLYYPSHACTGSRPPGQRPYCAPSSPLRPIYSTSRSPAQPASAPASPLLLCPFFRPYPVCNPSSSSRSHPPACTPSCTPPTSPSSRTSPSRPRTSNGPPSPSSPRCAPSLSSTTAPPPPPPSPPPRRRASPSPPSSRSSPPSPRCTTPPRASPPPTRRPRPTRARARSRACTCTSARSGSPGRRYGASGRTRRRCAGRRLARWSAWCSTGPGGSRARDRARGGRNGGSGGSWMGGGVWW